MGILTADMKRVVDEQKLGFVATVCPDGTPNLSPKGSMAAWDDDHVAFADMRSPGTMANLHHNSVLEVNVVDPVVRKGYRFKGRATIAADGPLLDEGIAFYARRGITNPIRAIVLVKVERALPLTSPAYDLGATEEEVRSTWQRYWDSLNPERAPAQARS